MKVLIAVAMLAIGGSARAQTPATGAPPPAAVPSENARCRLRVIHALVEEGGVDPELQPLRAKLTRPPFSSWKTFHLVSSEEHELTPTATVDYPLPDGRKATLLYAEHALDARGHHVVRGSLLLEGGRSTSRMMFSLDEGGLLLVAGAKHQGGILIYAVTCKTDK